MRRCHSMGKSIAILLTALTLCTVVTPLVGAAAVYETYTYSYEGKVQISPNAYTPKEEISVFGEAGTLNKPSDLFVDDTKKQVLIADKENNRIVILDENLQFVKQIKQYVNSTGESDGFAQPQGVFVASDGSLYVADTGNERLVVFNADGSYQRTILGPAKSILPDNFKYNPKAVSVDKSGRIYVVSANSNMGVIALDKDGSFEGFLGAQRVTPNMAELFWRLFMTQEQIARTSSFVPVEYSNLTIDSKGFVYVTSSAIDRYNLYQAVWTRSTSSSYAPVKKINPSGVDVLRRNGFFPPVGDISFDAYDGKKSVDPSQIGEVALLDNNMYALLDIKDNKIFTYDSYGNLLYAFGGTGEALGLYNQLASVDYLGNRMLTLDSADGSITVLQKTTYATLIDEVIGYQENREFDKAIAKWTQVLRLNNNFDMAYLGIGKTKLEQGDYTGAMEDFRLINNKPYYSKAFDLARQKFLESWGMLLFAGVLVLILLVVKFFGFAGKYNRRAMLHRKGTLGEELMFGFYVIFHPFDGFYELKREHRGSMRAAGIWLGIALFASVLQDLGVSYLQQSVGSEVTVFSSLANLLLPLALWCIANWCLTSLMDGKGNMREIFIASCYALIPLIVFTIPSTLISHVLVADELPLLAFFTQIGTVWTLALIFFGMMVTHDYSLGKNIIVTVLTIVGIGILLFLAMIFFSLTGRMISLVNNIVNEISFRM